MERRKAQLACITCGQVSWLDGFTVAEFDIGKMIGGALIDQARKHRKRNPTELKEIQMKRKG